MSSVHAKLWTAFRGWRVRGDATVRLPSCLPLLSPTMPPSSFSPDLLDPTSPAYKKARRQHYKTTKHRPAHVESEWTPFRAAEKKYKAHFPPPDLSEVLDLALLDETRADEVARGVWRGSAEAVPFKEMTLKGSDPSLRDKKAYIFPKHPGMRTAFSHLYISR